MKRSNEMEHSCNGTAQWRNGKKYIGAKQWDSALVQQHKVHTMAESALIETLQRESECVTRIRSAAAFQG